MERTANLPLGTLVIELVSNGEGIWVELENSTGGIVRAQNQTRQGYIFLLQVGLRLENTIEVAL